MFSVSRIVKLKLTDQLGIQVAEETLNKYFKSSYGVFAGVPGHRAILRFLPRVAHDVAVQHWHPDQEGRWDGEDYVLTIPYSQSRELIQDILRHLPYVVVEGPLQLRNEVRNILVDSAKLLYERT